MATDPSFLTIPRHYYGQASVANTGRDGTGTLVTLATGSNSYVAQILQVAVVATVTTTAGMIRLFLSLDGGTTKRLYDEIPIQAITVSATQPGYRTTRNYDALYLIDANTVLYASTHNAEAINLHAVSIGSA